MAEEQQEPTAEAIKQREKREKREKKPADDAKKGIGRFTVETADVFMPDLKPS